MKTVPLGEIAQLGSGGTPKRSVAEYFGPGIPWMSIADLNDGTVYGAKESLTESGIANSSAKVVPPGTILVAMYGSIGKLAVTAVPLCTSQAIAFVRPDTTKVDRKYLFHYLRAQRPQMQARGRGGTQMNISQGDLKKWPVPVPPLDEQRRIAEILDKADAIHENRLAAIDLFDQLSQSIFVQMLDQWSASKSIATVHLKDVTQRITYGFTNPMPHVPSGIPIVTARSIRDGIVDLAGGNFTTAEAFSALSDKSRPQSGDILITKDGTIGRCAVVRAGKSFCINQSVALVRPNLDEIEPDFLLGYFDTPSVQAAMNGMGKGNALKHLQITELGGFSLPLPDRRDQREYVKVIEHVRSLRSRQIQALGQDSQLFASLQALAFSGQL